MKYSVNFLQEIFTKHYAPFSYLFTNPEYAVLKEMLVNTVNDKELMDGIVFANDYLGVSPTASFVSYWEDQLTEMVDDNGDEENIDNDLSNEVRRAIGAFFAMVFKFILGYPEQKKTRCGKLGIRTATIYVRDLSEANEKRMVVRNMKIK